MKKTALALLLPLVLFVLLMVGVQSVKVAKGNPVPWRSMPNLEKPILTIGNPRNHTEYDYGKSILLYITVTKPDSWNAFAWPFWHYIGEIDSVDAYLDGQLVTQYGMSENKSSFSFHLNELSLGVHLVNVIVKGSTYYKGPVYGDSAIESGIVSDGEPVYEYPRIVSDIVYFTVIGEPSSVSPTPTVTPEPTPTPYQEPQQTEQGAIIGVAVVVAVIAAGLGLLIYLVKRK